MILTNVDRGSATWHRLLSHLNDCKHNVLLALGRDQSEQQTAKLRGELACLEKLINLDAEPEFVKPSGPLE